MSKIHNVEIKAKCSKPDQALKILVNLNALDKGVDHQIDTYFNNDKGRLKLRQGNIENSLIFYQRENQAGPKSSQISLTRLENNKAKTEELKLVLTNAYGVFKVVDKKRHILFIDNCKFHIDEVKGLGRFIEIEVIDETCRLSIEELQEKCEKFINILKISKQDFITVSYSDLIE